MPKSIGTKCHQWYTTQAVILAPFTCVEPGLNPLTRFRYCVNRRSGLIWIGQSTSICIIIIVYVHTLELILSCLIENNI